MFLGEDLIQWLLLAMGGALFAGNLLAVVKPPSAPPEEGQLERAPVARSLAFASRRASRLRKNGSGRSPSQACSVASSSQRGRW